MSLVFERIQTEGIAELSYLLGDDEEGTAAVFDPTPDVDKYIELAREKNVSITHVFETHIHADLISGARELCAQVDLAKIYVSHEAGAQYGFETEKLHDGDTFTFGDTLLTVRHTPGHTPEHISFEVAEKLQFDDVEEFTDYALRTAPPVPTYYPRMKKINAEGPKIIGHLPRVAALPAQAFKRAIEEKKGVLVDTRSMRAFGGGHIPGALNIGGSPSLSIWAGWLLDPQDAVLLVLENDNAVHDVVKLFVRTGYTKFAGYLVGGIETWESAGFPIEEIPQLSVHDLQRDGKDFQLLDVRGPGEWKHGHIPAAQHCFLPELRERSAGLDKTKPTAVYCASGYRASLAASILKQEGFEKIHNVPGSWQAWKKAGFPVER